MDKIEINISDKVANFHSFLSFETLTKELIKSGAIKEGEKITKFIIDKNGIYYGIRKGA